MARVLHVTAGAEKGGLEVVLLSIIKGLDRSRFLPSVLFLEDGPLVREVQETGTSASVVKAGRVRELIKGRKAIAQMVRTIRDWSIDIVHSHNAKAHVYGGLAAAIAGVPSLYHLHGVPKPRFSRDGFVSLLSLIVPASSTVACSKYVANTFRNGWGFRRKLLLVQNGSVFQSLPSTTDSTARAECGIPDGAPLIVMATRLQRWKGVHVFLDAAAFVARSCPNAHFIIVGGTLFGLDKDYPSELLKRVERLGLTGVVHFVGFRSDVFAFYRAADLVIHSAIEPEPFGMVLLEAMSCGKAVVASDSGGPREIVERDVTGLLVPPGNATRLAQAILDLLRDPARRVKMGKAGEVRAREFFAAERMVQQIEDIYVQMLPLRPI